MAIVIGMISGAVIMTGRKGGKRHRGKHNDDFNALDQLLSDQDEAWKILTGELAMTSEISTKWGQKAHKVTNQAR